MNKSGGEGDMSWGHSGETATRGRVLSSSRDGASGGMGHALGGVPVSDNSINLRPGTIQLAKYTSGGMGHVLGAYRHAVYSYTDQRRGVVAVFWVPAAAAF